MPTMTETEAIYLLRDLYRRDVLAYTLQRALLVAAGIIPADAPV